MKKRIAAILLALAMITTYMPTIAFAEADEVATGEEVVATEVVEETEEPVVEEEVVEEEVVATEEETPELVGHMPVVQPDRTIEVSFSSDMPWYMGPVANVLQQEKKHDPFVNANDGVKANGGGKIKGEIKIEPLKAFKEEPKAVYVNGKEIKETKDGYVLPPDVKKAVEKDRKLNVKVEYFAYGPVAKGVKVLVADNLPGFFGGAVVSQKEGHAGTWKAVDVLDVVEGGPHAGEIKGKVKIEPKAVKGYVVDKVYLNGKALNPDENGNYVPNPEAVKNLEAFNVFVSYKQETPVYKTWVKVNSGNATYDGKGHEVTATVGTGLQVLPLAKTTIEYYTVFGKQLDSAPTEAGVYAVKATYAGNEFPFAKYEGSSDFGWLYIAPKAITITLEDHGHMYGETPEALTYKVDGEDVEIPGFVPFVWNASKDVGTYAIYGLCMNTNYKAKVEPATYTITKRPLTFTWTLDKKDLEKNNVVKYDGKQHVAEVAVDNIVPADVNVIETVYSNNVQVLPGTYTARAELHSKPAPTDAVPATPLTPATFKFAPTAKMLAVVPGLANLEAPTAAQKIEVIENYEPLNSEAQFTIEDDLEITEIDTGDTTDVMPYAVAGIIALAGIVTLLVVRRKRMN